MREHCSNAKTLENTTGGIRLIIDTTKYGLVLGVIPHEVTHIVDYIESFIGEDGVNGGEYKAYLSGFINEWITSILLDHGYVIGKVNKQYLWAKINIADPEPITN
jgi:hypothetical protein